MYDPEHFQQETIKAIEHLRQALVQCQTRGLAQAALIRALVGQLPLAALSQVLEDYESGVDHQASQLEPEDQRPEFWQEWSELLESRRTELLQHQDQAKPAG